MTSTVTRRRSSVKISSSEQTTLVQQQQQASSTKTLSTSQMSSSSTVKAAAAATAIEVKSTSSSATSSTAVSRRSSTQQVYDHTTPTLYWIRVYIPYHPHQESQTQPSRVCSPKHCILYRFSPYFSPFSPSSENHYVNSHPLASYAVFLSISPLLRTPPPSVWKRQHSLRYSLVLSISTTHKE